MFTDDSFARLLGGVRRELGDQRELVVLIDRRPYGPLDDGVAVSPRWPCRRRPADQRARRTLRGTAAGRGPGGAGRPSVTGHVAAVRRRRRPRWRLRRGGLPRGVRQAGDRNHRRASDRAAGVDRLAGYRGDHGRARGSDPQPDHLRGPPAGLGGARDEPAARPQPGHRRRTVPPPTRWPWAPCGRCAEPAGACRTTSRSSGSTTRRSPGASGHGSRRYGGPSRRWVSGWPGSCSAGSAGRARRKGVVLDTKLIIRDSA